MTRSFYSVMFRHTVAVDSSGNAYVTGITSSTNFPTMNPLQPTHDGGGYDAFVAKINTKPSAAVTFVPPNLNFGNQTVGITSAPHKSTLTNTGDGALTITSVGVTGAKSGNFAENNNCGTSVPPFGSCDISVFHTCGHRQANRHGEHHGQCS